MSATKIALFTSAISALETIMLARYIDDGEVDSCFSPINDFIINMAFVLFE